MWPGEKVNSTFDAKGSRIQGGERDASMHAVPQGLGSWKCQVKVGVQCCVLCVVWWLRGERFFVCVFFCVGKWGGWSR